MWSKEQKREYQREWLRKNPHLVQQYAVRRKANGTSKRASRNYRLKKAHGIDDEHMLILIGQQKGLCALCERPLVNGGQIDVDHCHDTDVVRGIVHNKCNRLLACCEDSPALLRKAIDYLGNFGQSCSYLCPASFGEQFATAIFDGTVSPPETEPLAVPAEPANYTGTRRAIQ